VINETETIVVSRSAHELGCVAEKTPRGTPTITASPRLLMAKMIVCGKALPTNSLMERPVKTSVPRLPWATLLTKLIT